MSFPPQTTRQGGLSRRPETASDRLTNVSVIVAETVLVSTVAGSRAEPAEGGVLTAAAGLAVRYAAMITSKYELGVRFTEGEC
ncbi:hypothetical protein Ga0074812_12974 [Parafrankia irregularis]|uniref:Uncharacterized protein n=1 Tax=Parafrankia irregularis TaxID=795642 RepID=A0A0S4QVT5_9ACTN|nr:hypothetical protein Ga0074812_12974 [Parafrankia irregularis]